MSSGQNGTIKPLSPWLVDNARGFGIALVVLAHVNPGEVLGINPYGFHMPLFFFLSGAALRLEPPLASLAWRDAKAFLFYTIAHCGLLAAVTWFVFDPAGLNIQSTSPFDWRTYFVWPLTRNVDHVQLFLIGWFLISLFFVRLLTVAAMRPLMRLDGIWVSLAALLVALLSIRIGIHSFAVRYAASKWWAWNLMAQVAVGLGFSILGFLVQNRWAWRLPRHPLRFALVVFGLMVVLQLGPFIMSWSQYPGGTIATVLHASLGIALVLLVSAAMGDARWLQAVGRNSKWIMTWHLAAIALLNLCFVAAGYLQPEQVGVFSALAIDRSWPVYLAVGLCIPLLIAKAAGLAGRSLELRRQVAKHG